MLEQQASTHRDWTEQSQLVRELPVRKSRSPQQPVPRRQPAPSPQSAGAALTLRVAVRLTLYVVRVLDPGKFRGPERGNSSVAARQAAPAAAEGSNQPTKKLCPHGKIRFMCKVCKAPAKAAPQASKERTMKTARQHSKQGSTKAKEDTMFVNI